MPQKGGKEFKISSRMAYRRNETHNPANPSEAEGVG